MIVASPPSLKGCDQMATDDLQLTQIPSVKVGMLVRRPPGVVFQALVDPDITTRFWFTKSSGKVVAGATLRWGWEMYDVSANVAVKGVEENSRIVFDWGYDGETTTVEFRFIPFGDDCTYVQVTESGLSGDGNALVALAAGSTGGFTIALCALKALLEHDVVLTVVRDRFPNGLDAEVS
jgi:uncharacterized protein YndB with AHSA1/START domain